MSGILQLKYNTDAILDTYVGAQREITIGTDFWRPRVMEGVNAGGVKIALQSDLGAIGQCRLNPLSSLFLTLVPTNGDSLLVSTSIFSIAAAGLTISATGISTGQTYYIYGYSTGAALTLEKSTALPLLSTANGVYIKTGDQSRTCVGMARAQASSGWSTDSLMVASFFNRRAATSSIGLTGSTTSTATAWAEISSIMRTSMVCWGDESVQVMAGAQVTMGSSGQHAYMAVAFDGIVPGDGYSDFSSPASNTAGFASVTICKSGLAEGYHDVRVLGATDGAGNTATWLGGSSAARRAFSIVNREG